MENIIKALALIAAVALTGCAKGPDAAAVKAAEDLGRLRGETGFTVKALKTEVKGEEAVVELQVTGKDGKTETEAVKMVRKNNEWVPNL